MARRRFVDRTNNDRWWEIELVGKDIVTVVGRAAGYRKPDRFTMHKLEDAKAIVNAKIAERPMTVVLLGANGRYTAVADASRLRAWLEPARAAPKALSAPISKATSCSRSTRSSISSSPAVLLPS